MIVLICGLPGVGKSTLARDLASLIDAIVLSTDKIRKELISKPTYTKQERKSIYDILMLVAKYLHKAGINCILDADADVSIYRKMKRNYEPVKGQHIVADTSHQSSKQVAKEIAEQLLSKMRNR